MLNMGQDGAAVLQSLEASEATFNLWRNQYGGMKSEEAKRPKELEAEIQRLKEMIAEQALEFRILKHIVSKNWYALRPSVPGRVNSSSSFTLRSEGLAWFWISHATRNVKDE